MHPFDLKNAGATRAEMSALNNNDVNVCAGFDVMISHGWPAKLPRAAAVLSFFRYSALFFLFLSSFLQCFWPCPFFFLQGPMLT